MDLLEDRAALLGRAISPFVLEIVFEAGEGVRQVGRQLVPARLVGCGLVRPVFRVLHRQHVLRGAHEDRHRADDGRDGLDHLDPRGADADDADTLAFQIKPALRISPGVNDLAPEAVLPLEAVGERCREHPGAADQELGVIGLAGVGRDIPAAGVLVEIRLRHPRGEGEILAQVKPVGNVVHPAFDLGLRREAFGPSPVLVERFVEQVLVDIALAVELGPGIAVPVPRAAEVRSRLDPVHVHPHLSKLVKLVQPRHACADHEGVNLARHVSLPSGFPAAGAVSSAAGPVLKNKGNDGHAPGY